MSDPIEKPGEYAAWKNIEGCNSYECLQTEKDQTIFGERERKSASSPTDKAESKTLASQKHCTLVHNRCTRNLQHKRQDIAAVHTPLKRGVGRTAEAERSEERCSLISAEIAVCDRNMDDTEIEVGQEAFSLESSAASNFDEAYPEEISICKDQKIEKVKDLQKKSDTDVVEHIKMNPSSLEAPQDIMVNRQRLQSGQLHLKPKLTDSIKLVDIKQKRHSSQFMGDNQIPILRQSEKNISTASKVLGAKSNDVVHSYMILGRSSRTQREEKLKLHSDENNESTPEAKSYKKLIAVDSHDNDSMTSKKPMSLNSLEDALTHFGLWTHLQQLEMGLEDVRRHKKTKKEHESDMKEMDKVLQKLSFKFHPDKMKNRGCTEEELAEAHILQAALNATRTVFNILTDVFLSDLAIDHKYGFYTKFNITSLGNEGQIRNHIYEVIFQIGMLSEIKQQRIITEIGKFLKESKCCVANYLGNKPNEFVKNRDAALHHLKSCIRGYENLCSEFKAVEKHCKRYEKFETVHKLLSKTASECSRELSLLRQLKSRAKESLAGNLKLYDPSEDMDDYFVQPFVYYTNVILMCNTVIFSKGIRKKFSLRTPIDEPKYSKEIEMLLEPYYLASYCNGNKQFKPAVKQIFRDAPFCQKNYKVPKDIVEIKKAFDFYIKDRCTSLEQKFKAEDYFEYSTRNELVEELKKCMSMMHDFQKKEDEISKEIHRLKSKTEDLEEKYSEIMRRTEEHNQNVKERLERNRRLSEKTAMVLTDRQMRHT